MFNRLTKLNFNAKMGEVSKNLATSKKVENVLDLAGKNRQKKSLNV